MDVRIWEPSFNWNAANTKWLPGVPGEWLMFRLIIHIHSFEGRLSNIQIVHVGLTARENKIKTAPWAFFCSWAFWGWLSDTLKISPTINDWGSIGSYATIHSPTSTKVQWKLKKFTPGKKIAAPGTVLVIIHCSWNCVFGILEITAGFVFGASESQTKISEPLELPETVVPNIAGWKIPHLE